MYNCVTKSVSYAMVTLPYFRRDAGLRLVKLENFLGEKQASNQGGYQGGFWCATGVHQVVQVGAAGGEVCALSFMQICSTIRSV